jgi:NAD(P)H-hydrate epimerase
MKIFTSRQIHDIDKYTIEKEPVKSVDLMERASGKLFEWIINRFAKKRRFLIFAGPGNNGGDGLVLARLLSDSGYRAEVHYVSFTKSESNDWKINRERLNHFPGCAFYTLDSPDDFPMTSGNDIIVDAIFGSGLTRPPEGLATSVIMKINSSGCEVISVDIPSGLPGEDIGSADMENIVRARHTLSFQFPKLSFMFPDSYPFTGDWHLLPIGLHPDAILDTTTPYNYTEEEDILPLLKPRKKFDHKGIFGHGLLVAGSRNKAGAAVLSAMAALRTGIGLITCHIPASGCTVIQSAIPEAMVRPDRNDSIITAVENPNDYSAIGVGPGIGTSEETANGVRKLIEECSKPIVLDADALNILSLHKEWLALLRPGTILTPHLKEFERLAGKAGNSYERVMMQIDFSLKYKCIVVLKGAHTSVALPDGKVYFNSTGNPGMAKGGSGDVLTGIVLSLLAQGYQPADAAVAAVFIHGMAGDIALRRLSPESVIATDITENISEVFLELREKKAN